MQDLEEEGVDTALARALHDLGSVQLDVLRTALDEVRARRGRAAPLTLATVLQERDLVDPSALEAAFRAVGQRAQRVRSAALQELRLPADLHGYRVVRELSRGGMGAVHEIEHLESGGRLALKTILPNSGRDDEEEVERFRREGVALARLTHAHVVAVHSARLEGSTPYLIQDLLPGGTLEARIKERGPLPFAEALSLIRKLGAGLAHAHERGVLHRDLKPLNVLFDDRDEPRLVDFGLARLTSTSSLTHSGQLLGTPSYMAPEQALGAAVDERTDVYGLATILYAMLTGRPPFQGAGLEVLAAVVHDAPLPPSQSAPVPPWLEGVVLKALAKEPAERYPSVGGFLEALEGQLAPPRPPSRRPLWIGVALLLAVVALGGGVAVKQNRAERQAAQAQLALLLSAGDASRGGSEAPRFRDLEAALASYQPILGSKAPDVCAARALVAIGADREEDAARALADLKEAAGEAARVKFLSAACAARWSDDPALLRAAASELRARLRQDEAQQRTSFADLSLLLGRAYSLSSTPSRALEAFGSAGEPLARAPWDELVLRSAGELASVGRLTPERVAPIAAWLPPAAKIERLARFSALVANFEVAPLVALLEDEPQVPAPVRASLRREAALRLKTARVPKAVVAGTEATHDADRGHADELVLGLRLVSPTPPLPTVYAALSDWSLVAHVLELEAAPRIDESARAALTCVGALDSAELGREWSRLYRHYLRANPDDRHVLGKLALAALSFFPPEVPAAAALLREFTRDLPAPLSDFWELWVIGVALKSPNWERTPEQVASAKKVQERVKALGPAIARASTPKVRAALLADPASAAVLGFYQNLEAVYARILGRASFLAHDYDVAIAQFQRLFDLRGEYPDLGWIRDAGLTYLESWPPPTAAQRARRLAEIRRFLVFALAVPGGENLDPPLRVAYLLRTEVADMTQELFRAFDRHDHLVTDPRLHLRHAWFALKHKEARLASEQLAKAESLAQKRAENGDSALQWPHLARAVAAFRNSKAPRLEDLEAMIRGAPTKK